MVMAVLGRAGSRGSQFLILLSSPAWAARTLLMLCTFGAALRPVLQCPAPLGMSQSRNVITFFT